MSEHAEIHKSLRQLEILTLSGGEVETIELRMLVYY